MEIDGHFVPGGTIVGVSAWVLHKSAAVFDPQRRFNVDQYIPERWLESSKEQLKEMNGNMFQFGAGVSCPLPSSMPIANCLSVENLHREEHQPARNL